MSSLFTASEIALADKGLAALDGDKLDVLVGGLGLGYTAQAVLAHESVADLTVVDLLEPVIRWHEEGLVPMKTELADSPRCRLVKGDFSFSFGPGAELPSAVMERQMMMEGHQGHDMQNMQPMNPSEIRINGQNPNFDPPFAPVLD